MLQDPDNRLHHFPTERKKGAIGTIIFHIVLIAILVIAGFTSSPPPEEEGLLVNYGMDVFGTGITEPSPRFAELTSPETTQTPPPATPPPPVTSTQSQEETLLTQDFEEALEVRRAEEQKREEEIKKEEERQREIEAAEAERRRIEEEERVRREEEERVRREEEERKRKEEEERQRAAAISSMVGNALATARNTGTVTTGEGTTTGTGNQGAVTGSVDSRVRGQGAGTGTDSTSFSLDGRTAQSLPLPVYDRQIEGIVVVEITVDRAGRVTSANPGGRGSTTIDESLMRLAKEAAEKARFDAKQDAPLVQRGTITYIFKLR